MNGWLKQVFLISAMYLMAPIMRADTIDVSLISSCDSITLKEIILSGCQDLVFSGNAASLDLDVFICYESLSKDVAVDRAQLEAIALQVCNHITRVGCQSRIGTILTKACAILDQTEDVCEKFQGTWTLLAALPVSTTTVTAGFPCDTSTPISAPTIISQPGSYCLVNDIVGTITIAADRVFLDLNEKTISGAFNGIEIDTQEVITIHNGIIKDNSGDGIFIESCTNVQIENVVLSGNTHGVFAQRSDCIELNDCVFDSQVSDGIRFSEINSSQIINNKIRANGSEGIILENGSIGNTITNNDILQNSAEGIEINASTRNSIQHNVVCNGNSHGILLDNAANNNIVLENQVNINSSSGVRIDASFDNLIKSNICNNNTGAVFAGISLVENSSRNQVTSNICNSNAGRGVFLDASGTSPDDNLVNNNSCSFNDASGIEITSNDNTVLLNTINQNGVNGILNSGTGNKFFNNSAFENASIDFSGVQIEIQGQQPTNCRYVCSADLPLTINQAGTYCLAEDVTGQITISANNVILNLSERILTTAATGITVSAGVSAVVIKNGFINSSGATGVSLDTCANVKIFEVDFSGGGARGVDASAATCVEIEGCTFRDFTTEAIRLNNSDNSLVSKNKIERNARGILLDGGSQNNIISANTFVENTNEGIELSGASENVLEENECFGGSIGINLESSSIDNTIQKNNCSNNSSDGIRIVGSSNDNLVQANICNNNSGGSDPLGICAVSSSGNRFIDNVCNDNRLQGIGLFNGDNSLLCGNNCSGNGAQGILLNPSSDNNQVIDNTLTYNSTFGIQNSGSNNKIFNNSSLKNGTNYTGVSVEAQGVAPRNCRYICGADVPLTISTPGIYCLLEDATGQITIDSNDVVLDLNNRRVSAGGATGIEVSSGHGDIIIKDGIVDGATTQGILIDTSSHVLVQNVELFNIGDGIFIDTCEAITIRDCFIHDNTNAIEVDNTNNSIIFNNKLVNNGTGILAANSTSNVIQANSCNDNSVGIAFTPAVSSSIIIDNSVIDNSLNTIGAIRLSASSENNVLARNVCSANLSNGIENISSDQNTIVDNVCTANDEFGIDIVSSSSTIVARNICSENTLDGISIVNASSENNTIVLNETHSNSLNGIDVLGSTNSRVHNNRSRKNITANYSGVAAGLLKAATVAATQGSNLT